MNKVIAALALAMCGFAAQAEYLYWTVNDSYTMQNTDRTYTWSDNDPSQANAFYAASLVQVGTDGAKTLRTAQPVKTEGGVQKTYAVEITNGDNYGYYIELLSWNGSNFNQVGLTETRTYAQLAMDGVIYSSASLTPVPTATWHGGDSMNAPEPTSAYLMMLGVAGLALRRKPGKTA